MFFDRIKDFDKFRKNRKYIFYTHKTTWLYKFNFSRCHALNGAIFQGIMIKSSDIK